MATFKPALVVAAVLGTVLGAGALIVLAVIAFIAIFGGENRRDAALDVLRAIFGSSSTRTSPSCRYRRPALEFR